MKKIIIILSSFFCLNGFSQLSFQVINMATSATVAPNEVIDLTTVASTETSSDFDIKNISSATHGYNLKRYDIVLHTASSATADAHFCYNGTCYLDMTMMAGPVNLAPGGKASDATTANNYLTADLDEISTVGPSLVKYTFINAANAADSLQFSLRYNSNSLGFAKNSINIVSCEIFPNPANEYAVLKITSPKAIDSKLILFNALGAVVSEMPVSINEGDNKINLDINQLNSGIYFVQLKMANSSVTKKLVVK